jgi:hypothetical protein
MLAFHPRIAVVTGAGNHLRYVHRSLAHAMVDAGSAAPVETSGRIRAVALSRPASAFAQRTGPPTAAGLCAVRFTRRVRLDSGASIVEHHPRCLFIETDA